jgi:hypothetical protein
LIAMLYTVTMNQIKGLTMTCDLDCIQQLLGLDSEYGLLKMAVEFAVVIGVGWFGRNERQTTPNERTTNEP